MKQIILLLGLLVLTSCDSQSIELDDASAVISIDGKRFKASASVVTKELGAESYQAVLFVTTDLDRIEILGLAFEAGKYVKQHEANSTFPYAVSYREALERAPVYMASKGSLQIIEAEASVLEGEFEFETINALSSCSGCEAAKGPTVSGRFRAVRR
jgi:hypothetical protein